MHRAGDRAYHQRLRESGYADEQRVAPGKHGHENLVEHLLLADYRLGDFRAQRRDAAEQLLAARIAGGADGGSGHASTGGGAATGCAMRSRSVSASASAASARRSASDRSVFSAAAAIWSAAMFIRSSASSAI